MPFSWAAALMRTIQIERYWRFFCLRPEYANFSPRSTLSLAERYSFDFVRKYPLARSSIFFLLARLLVPRFTRGMGESPFLSTVMRLEVRVGTSSHAGSELSFRA